MSIHPKFAQWYAQFQAQPGGERQAARSTGIEAFIENCGTDDIEPLLVLAYGLRAKDHAGGIGAFRQALASADESFPDDNAHEMQVLAAATLASILTDDSDLSAYTALAVTTTELGGARVSEAPMNLGTMAADTIGRIADRNATRPELTGISPPAPQKWDAAPHIAKINAGEADALSNLLTAFLNTVRKDISAQRDHQSRILNTIEQFVSVQDDELQVLWWLVGARSELVDMPFDDIPVADRHIVLAVEFAGLCRELPGPASARSVLSKAGIANDKRVSVAETLSAAEKLSLANADNPSPVLHPLHFAIKRMDEVDNDPSWVKGWATLCGISEDASLSLLDFAELFYREELLLKNPEN